MQVDYVLILAAGKGSRMGEIGRHLPKVLWPVFEKSLLELEIAYANQFNPKKIFINLFHKKTFIKEQILNKSLNEKVILVEEDSVLDIGGAIHNIAANLDYRGNLLVINCDQFIILDDSIKKAFSKKCEESDVCLLSYTVDSIDGYNALEIEGDYLSRIVSNSEINKERCDTYTGMSCIRLEALEKVTGESKFFQSVANPGKTKVSVLNIKSSKYWDFGTLNRYYGSMFSILNNLNNNVNDPFISFLYEAGAINKEKLGLGGYSAPEKIINLGKNTNMIKNTIYLTDTEIVPSGNHSIVSYKFEDLVTGFE